MNGRPGFVWKLRHTRVSIDMDMDYGAMKKLLYLMMGLMCTTLSSCSRQSGDENKDQPQTGTGNYVSGEALDFSGVLIDTRCYSISQENTGKDHDLPDRGFVKACASLCAQQGFPVAVLVDGEKGGKVWILMFSSQVFADFMAETVRVHATWISDGLVEPKSIDMQTEGGWVQIL